MNIQPLNTWITNGNEPLLIAGPCGAETRAQVLETAKGIFELNADFLKTNNSNKISLFRAGVWKPRTRPNSFEGIGEEALKWLQEVKQQYGLKTTVEIANAQHAELALKYGVDVLWIGARTTVNPFSVQEIADFLKGMDVPVLIKNPVHADLQLWLGAIERISLAGITKLAAVHRGFHSPSKTKYRNKPMWEIAIELKTILPNLPIICDPSHISGNRELIPSVAQKALDLGMNGLMIETHCNPSVALSDAQQQLTPTALSEVLANLVYRESTLHKTECRDKLAEFRNMIDDIDDELLNVLKKRNTIIEQIGDYKKQQNITIFQLERWKEILQTRKLMAEKIGVSSELTEKICWVLHDESIRIQTTIMNKKRD